ncbi:MAG: hypothetical protein IPJ41_17965 [Phycisphaerales bacterium]|nr:hypothetical protein [Phycisphaerales bacterium]
MKLEQARRTRHTPNLVRVGRLREWIKCRGPRPPIALETEIPSKAGQKF